MVASPHRLLRPCQRIRKSTPDLSKVLHFRSWCPLSHDYQFQLPRLFPAYINHTDDLDYFVFHINPEMDMVVFHPALRTPRSCHGCSGVRCTLSGMGARDFISALIAAIVFFAAIGAQRSCSIYLRISLRWSLAWRVIRTLCSSIQSRLRFLKDFVHIEGIVS